MYLHIKPKDIMIMAPTTHIIKTIIIIVDTYPIDKYENSKYSNNAMDTIIWNKPKINTIDNGLKPNPFIFIELITISAPLAIIFNMNPYNTCLILFILDSLCY